MRGRRAAEQLREGVLRVVVEVVLIPEEDHLVLEERPADELDGVAVEVAAEAHTLDPGSDVGAEFDGSGL
ncbi:hypothetical protein GCM10009722_11070 [Williamsia deligens]